MNLSQRGQSGNILKSVFNKLWGESLKRNEGNIPYRDMVRIADAVRVEGPSIISRRFLPEQIEAGLDLAIAAVDPNKARFEQNVKKGLVLALGSGGISLAWVSFGGMVSPGIWALIVAFFAGGVAGGPFAILGVTAGLSVAAAATYVGYQKISPGERAAKAHALVMKSIDMWIQDGGGVRAQAPASGLRPIVKSEVPSEKLTDSQKIAVRSLLNEIAHVDGVLVESELAFIQSAFEIKNGHRVMECKRAIQLLKRLQSHQKRMVVAWCFGVAYADGQMHRKEDELLKRLCDELTVDYDSIAGGLTS